jgi:uncharacterized protein YeaO (DUF488 family)
VIKVKRIYEPPDRHDGFRVLVDRIWPRGVRKNEARIDLWLKDIAPSTELRRWFGHDPTRWAEFCRHYRAELKQHADALAMLRNNADGRVVTLLYAAHDSEHNNAVALANVLRA